MVVAWHQDEQAALPEVTACKRRPADQAGTSPSIASARQLGTRGVATYLRRLADHPIPGRLVHDYSHNRNAFVARDENREDVARYRASNNEMERRSLTRLPANQYTFGTLDTIEDALQTLDPGRQAAPLRALSNRMDSTFLVLHEDPHRPASPHGALGDNAESAILRMNINPSRIVDTDPLGVDPNPGSDQQVSEVSENRRPHGSCHRNPVASLQSPRPVVPMLKGDHRLDELRSRLLAQPHFPLGKLDKDRDASLDRQARTSWAI
ncbi:hypothetical protein Pst134EA_032947 [Puccinia striiformis f. sp. tritici]|uniref:uncharacterized protein n=1 Tax=Puccinia striiformis f. sp. tritici TaxID=168172 RepID=UPI002008B4DA|nr:uncharacterized protein Pst134EA_032947 [Puccinia striiformis f. sp. tritici]KAH9441512.1 hypothetical protein Pst134EA_032947 [Puccinia striiformis f. sp. tritici]